LSDGSITFATLYGKRAAILQDNFNVDGQQFCTLLASAKDLHKPPILPCGKQDNTPQHHGAAKPRPVVRLRNALPTETCLRCEGKGYWAADCISEGRLTMTDAIAARLRGADSEKSARVLFQFYQDFDAVESHRDELASDEAAEQEAGELCNTFFALMNWYAEHRHK
jgi:hypothetical protein